MDHILKLYNLLKSEEKLHREDIFNYAIPKAWNTYGYSKKKTIRSNEILINPYSFYLYTLEHILMDADGKLKQAIPFMEPKAKKGSWLKTANVYFLMVRSATAWDHDRDDCINHDDLYHLSDNGTFFKSIFLLPYLKRIGINTILMHQPFSLCKTNTAHTYAEKECVTNFRVLDDSLRDPLLPNMSVEEQCLAFVEACHLHGIRIILEFCPGKLAKDNDYLKDHPEWFYWIDATKENVYHAPTCMALPANTIPHTYALKDFYRSDEVKEHLSYFRQAPEAGKQDLSAYRKEDGVTIASVFSDQINAHLDVDRDGTVYRFYQDAHAHLPKSAIEKTQAPYLLQDSIRTDLHPGKKPMRALWDYLNETIAYYQQTFQIDGIYLEKTYLLPEKLQKEFVKTARKNNRSFAMIAEDTVVENSVDWVAKGFDAISGNGGYEETNLSNFHFHKFAYRLKDNACPMFAACEFFDSRRVSALDHGVQTSMLLHVMNQFLPNGIPMMMNGAASFDVQPMQLSEYGDRRYLNSLPKSDKRYKMQSYLDPYYFDYCASNLNVLPALLEKCANLRKQYLPAISNPEKCVPVWFDSPKDLGIGYSFVLEDRALMVICNTNVDTTSQLHIHTENLYAELGFKVGSILQIFSTKDPYVQDVPQDEFRNLPLSFDCGEVKFIEFMKAEEKES